MKIIELHLAKLFETQARTTPSVTAQLPVRQSNKPRGINHNIYFMFLTGKCFHSLFKDVIFFVFQLFVIFS